VTVRSLSEAVERIIADRSDPIADPSSGARLGERSLQVLQNMSAELERLNRPRRQQDFSLILMMATLVQMLALMAAFWGTAALYEADAPSAAARFALACFFQAAAIGAWVVDRFR
jgi:hypothetical protein